MGNYTEAGGGCLFIVVRQPYLFKPLNLWGISYMDDAVFRTATLLMTHLYSLPTRQNLTHTINPI